MRVLITGGSGLVGRYVVEETRRHHAVEILDLRPPHRSDLPFHCVDLLDPQAVARAVRGFDGVVHMAGIPHPLNHPPEEVYRTNVLSTFNLLEACARAGIQRLVFLSSESTLGFAFSETRMWPEYIPIDEHHPLRPQDPYGLSKLTSELLCEGVSRRTGMRIIALRPPWIWVPEPEEIGIYRTLVQEYPKWFRNLWAYVHVHDVARAVRQCLELSDPPPFERFFISAEDNWTGVESRALIAQFYPETKQIAREFGGTQSLISSAKAREHIGFCPAFSRRDVLQA